MKLLYAFLLNKKRSNCSDVQKVVPICKAYVDCVNTYSNEFCFLSEQAIGLTVLMLKTITIE